MVYYKGSFGDACSQTSKGLCLGSFIINQEQ